MKNEHLGIDPNSGATAERLIRAVIDQWSASTRRGPSVRSLTQDAGVPNSCIYHHFGNLERLFFAAQTEAIEKARAWVRSHVAALSDLPPAGPVMMGPVMAAIIDDWCATQRDLAFAWRECCLLALRNPNFGPLWEQWHELWLNLWSAACRQFGVAHLAEATTLFFDSECLMHLMRWQRPLDRAALEDFCAGWASWLQGHLAPEGRWRRLCRQHAVSIIADPRQPDEIGRRVIDAAGAVLSQGGFANLTHRRVAIHAGVSVGALSNRVRTSADLARAAFEGVMERYLSSPSATEAQARHKSESRGNVEVQIASSALTREEALDIMKSSTVTEDTIATEELLLSVARDPSLGEFVPQLRYLRGRTSGPTLAALLRKNNVSAQDSALFSGLYLGICRKILISMRDDTAESKDRYVRDHALQLIVLLSE